MAERTAGKGPTLLVMAAGGGARYGGLKQLAPVGPTGETLLEYSVYDALRAGFERVALVVRAGDETRFRERFADGMARKVPLAYVHQTVGDLPAGCVAPAGRVKPWGTGQAVLAARSEIEGAFAVVNADDFYGAGSFDVLAGFLGVAGTGRPKRLAIVGFRLAETLSESGPVCRALCRADDDGLLREIVELERVRRGPDRINSLAPDGSERPLLGDETVSMNMWGLHSDLFPALERRFRRFLAAGAGSVDDEFLLPDVIQAVVCEEGARVEVLRAPGPWCGITFRDDEERAAALIASWVADGEYPEGLWR